MNTLKLIAIGILFSISSTIEAQVSVNVNIGSPPSWGPAGYSNVGYYYLPDIESYYDVRNSQFICFNHGKWYRYRHLPNQYRNYDLYRGYKVILNDYHGSKPFAYFKNHKVKYYKGYKGKPQKSIGTRNNNSGHNNKQWNKNQNNGKENKSHGKNRS
jgi:hypothetical protein